MRFSESKKGKSWILIIAVIVVGAFLTLGFCQFGPATQIVQKTIVFEAD